jgi:CHAD domain-containing protein
MPPELEAKLIAPGELRLPDLSGLVKAATAVRLPDRHLDAIYYDTADFGLVRNGITLRYRSGEGGPPWTVKLPDASSGAALRRREVSFDGAPGRVPPQAADLVRAYTRSRPLVRMAHLKTDRTAVEIRGPDGGSLAEITDDRVAVYGERGRRTGGFREIEVEVYGEGRAGRRLIRAAISRLVAAGCRAEPPIPKVIRALGPPASGPPDAVVPPIGADATVSTLIRYATARSVTQILRHDPGVRLGEDPEDVHQFRVATRRLRSDLRTFAPLLDPEPVSEVRGRLRQLGAQAGAARDTDVLADRLKAKADMLPEQDAPAIGQLLHHLEDQAREARSALLQELRSPGYDQLLDTLVGLAARPPIAAGPPGLADQRAADLAAGLIRRPWRRLNRAARALAKHSPDTQWHAVRIRAKQCRYAAEAVTPVCGRQARRFAAAVAAVQDILGDHQDTVVAEAWLRNTGAAVTPACVAAGELITSVRLERAGLRWKWPKAWKRASARKLRRWMRKGRHHTEPRHSITAPPAGRPLARTGESGAVPAHR